MIWRWLMRRRSSTVSTPAPSDTSASGRSDEAVTERMNSALRQTQNETRAMRRDGLDLADRIRHNARAGREAFEGKS